MCLVIFRFLLHLKGSSRTRSGRICFQFSQICVFSKVIRNCILHKIQTLNAMNANNGWRLSAFIIKVDKKANNLFISFCTYVGNVQQRLCRIIWDGHKNQFMFFFLKTIIRLKRANRKKFIVILSFISILVMLWFCYSVKQPVIIVTFEIYEELIMRWDTQPHCIISNMQITDLKMSINMTTHIHWAKIPFSY